ncbi:MAG: DNA repair protein RecN [Winogradskyella sp.]|nr:DNA repair protein RecN [Winogradskyella sp.]
MLTGLSIANYALIDELNVKFNSGLTIITGETGAGKSILLGGLSLVLGKRADLSQVKDTSKKCIIEATFDIAKYGLKPLFNSEDLDYEPQTIIRREILPSGKSRAFVNDTPVTLDSLVALSDHLLDIHSQHQTRQLIEDDYQFQVIDALANNTVLLNEYKNILNHFKHERAELERLEAAKAESIKEYDYNLFLLNELKEAQLKADELDELESTFEQLNNVEVIQEKLLNTQERLTAEDLGVLDSLKLIRQELAKISGFSRDYEVLEQRISSVIIEMDDILTEIAQQGENLSADPKELERVNQKLTVINSLLRKHAVTSVPELIEIRTSLEAKVSEGENLDGIIEEKRNIIDQHQKQLITLGKTLHNNREAVTPTLIEKLELILKELGMPNARFKILIEQTDEFKTNGLDSLQFLFTANKGTNFTELKKSASGGELSRIMLAIKSILADYVVLPTIMFDEIDTGVSGEISNKMASIMKQMSKRMQVFTITHLPQIAAKGDWHFKVYKTDVNNITQTRLKSLTQDERIVEIAQMLGGLDVTDSALAHAKQLLN